MLYFAFDRDPKMSDSELGQQNHRLLAAEEQPDEEEEPGASRRKGTGVVSETKFRAYEIRRLRLLSPIFLSPNIGGKKSGGCCMKTLRIRNRTISPICFRFPSIVLTVFNVFIFFCDALGIILA